MNWTEGVLARARKNGKSEELSRQREFFARARMRQNGAINVENSAPNHPNEAILRNADSRDAVEDRATRSQLTGTISTKRKPCSSSTSFPQSNVSYAGNPSAPYEEDLLSQSSHAECDDVDTSHITAKKQRLLSKVDWTGISLQKPLTITYPQPKKLIRGHHVPRNPRKAMASGSTSLAPIAPSTPDEIRVCVGSQKFR